MTRGRAMVASLGLAAALVLGLRALAPAQVPGYGDWLDADAGTGIVEAAPGFGPGAPGAVDDTAEPAVEESPELDLGAAGATDGAAQPVTGGGVGVTGAAPGALDGGAAADAGVALADGGAAVPDGGAPLADAGPALTLEELVGRIEELQQRQAESETEQQELQAQITELQGQLEAQQATAARAEQSREFRVRRLGEAVRHLTDADALLIEGTLSAAGALDQTAAELAESLDEARTFGSGFEADQTQRALSRVQAA
ncbi:MAG: hypothetical protein ACYC8T_13560, partial [Myxococcaceae bacterium]